MKAKHDFEFKVLPKLSMALDDLPSNEELEKNFCCLVIDTDTTDLLYVAKLLAKVMTERYLLQIVFIGKLESKSWLQLPMRLEQKGQILLLPVREINETFVQSYILLKNSWETKRKLSDTMQVLEETLNQQHKVLPMMNLDDTFSGQVIHGYEVLERIGEGNTGIVYLARKHGELQAPRVAVKVLKSMNAIPADEREEATERFIREAEVMEQVRHLNVVQLLDYGLDDGHKPYIVMEYVEGVTLRHLIEKEPESLTIEAIVKIAAQLCSALEEIHDEGFCHRDVKPDNIIITKDDKLKLMDFGLASLPDSTLTLNQNLLGSPAYMSPEAYTNASSDPRSDLFSVGVVIYECLTKRLPWKSSNLAMLAYESQHLRIVRPMNRNRAVPAILDKLVMTLLKQDPVERYQAAEDVVEALKGTGLLKL